MSDAMQTDFIPSPKENLHFVGHKEAEEKFLSSWNSGKTSGSWLITGPKGVGKASLAYRIARFVFVNGKNKEQGGLFGESAFEEFDSLDVSAENEHVKKVSSSSHPDLKIIEREITDDEKKKLIKLVKSGSELNPDEEKKRKKSAFIRVDSVRQMNGFLSMTSSDGGWRAVIVDAADDMNIASANAILKILEEPPENTLMILISHNQGKLLPTIKSRCTKIALKPLENDVIEGLLSHYIPEISENDASKLSILCSGSIGQAIELYENNGLAKYKEMVSIFERYPSVDLAKLHAFANKIIKSPDDFEVFQFVFSSFLSRIIRAFGKGENLVEICPGENAIKDNICNSVTPDVLIDRWQEANELFAKTNNVNLDKKQTIINVIMGLMKA
jgi:DNA polymerase-3 subunit delta'